MRLINNPCAGGILTRCSVIVHVFTGICIAVGGCKSGSEMIWSAEYKSPGGQWLASGQTVAQSGFGTGCIGTKVYLNWTQGSQPKVLIVDLSYESEVPRGITNVEMKWITPTHLEVTYKGHPRITFQAIKCGGMDIAVRDVSSGAVKSTQ